MLKWILVACCLACGARAQGLLPSAPPAPAQVSCAQGSAFADGCAGAPTGTIQLPNLFSGYATRPAWNVAGVDYYVGLPSNVTLKDPATAALPSGVTRNSSSHSFAVNSNNVTLDGWDFSLEGGWIVTTGSTISGLTIQNCNFFYGSNFGTTFNPILQLAGTSYTLQNNTFGADGTQRVQIVNYVWDTGNGARTIQYNYFHDAPEEDIQATGTVQMTLQYNLFYKTGDATNASPHPDTFQSVNAITSDFDQFNTIVQPNTGEQGGMEAINLNSENTPQNLSFANATVRNNTILAKSGSAADVMSFVIATAHTTGGSVTNVNVWDNYLDTTSSFGPYFSLDGTETNVVYTGDTNLVTGGTFALPAHTLPSNVASVTANPASGTVNVGGTVTLTLNMQNPTNVTGTPTLSLNTGATAPFTSGSGSTALVFTYTVGAGDTGVANLAITAVNLPGGATIKDTVGNAEVMSGALVTFTGLAIQ